MKIKMLGYDVSISAKHEWQDKKSKQATLELLNYISLLTEIASQKYKEGGYDKAAQTIYDYSNEIYEVCKDNGLYKG